MFWGCFELLTSVFSNLLPEWLKVSCLKGKYLLTRAVWGFIFTLIVILIHVYIKWFNFWLLIIPKCLQKSFSSYVQVNIIPIIAKSDAISKSELAKFKIKITSELVSNGVQIYQFPTDDETVAEINSTMNVSNLYSDKNCFQPKPFWRVKIIKQIFFCSFN